MITPRQQGKTFLQQELRKLNASVVRIRGGYGKPLLIAVGLAKPGADETVFYRTEVIDGKIVYTPITKEEYLK